MLFPSHFVGLRTTDTICAISTPSGQGGIAVVRISGVDAYAICSKILNFKAMKGRVGETSLFFARIFRGEEILDEVLVSTFHAPHSYTGEDVVEISCHGSLYIQQEIIKLLIANGCRLAAAGEFTQRAFFNGKLDLSQAEAVADLIAASSSASHRVAMQQLRGGVSNELDALREKLLNFTSLVELELDFADEDVEFADRTQLMDLALQIAAVISRLADSFSVGNAIKNGISVAIVGETNVGKSTLLNSLLREEKAIVSDVHGTTRDAIEDTIVIDGLLFRFVDTAGIRSTNDAIEQMGIERSFQKIEQAGIALWVIDLTGDTQETSQLAEQIINRDRNKKIILTLNKADMLTEEGIERKTKYYKRFHDDFIVISAKSPTDVAALERKLVETANIQQTGDNNVIVTNLRHYEALKNALTSVERVIDGMKAGITGDFLSQDIRECLSYLNEITGQQISTDDVLGNIFKNFCIGK